MDNIWFWIVVGIVAVIISVLTIGSNSHKGRSNADLTRRGGGKMLKDYDEDQNFIDKYSR